MGLLSAKAITILAAGTITVSAATFGATDVVDSVKNNISSLKQEAQLLHDEAFAKITNANGVIAEKNTEIERLEVAFDQQNAQTTKANAEIIKGDSEIEKANSELDKAEAAIGTLNTESKNALDTVSALKDLPAVEDTDYSTSIVGKQLSIAYAAGKIKLANPNTLDVEVRTVFKGVEGTIIVPAGDVVYIEKATSQGNHNFYYTTGGVNYEKKAL
ncbi:hypothetical protein [Rossellomorea aquimaris]|uniref:Uncharacterized protein n=1 Tax=Rossellomorea aquimaris TaxID=189382 RepID=A0A5D4TLR0_9BACI|nr:hypothetical protein [Rossellomorea aquimaris]TYS75751.1 hypothetical protein FZC80_16235 [Rossellomorea aquimaris]